MLHINVDIQGDKVVINGLQRFENALPGTLQRGLSKIARGVHREAFDFLSGAMDDTGGYPVPVRTGHLRRNLDWLDPGETKTADGETYAAGPLEAVVYDSAIYADVIHAGHGSSANHGPREFLDDALETFNRKKGVQDTMENEISKELIKVGM